MKSRLLVGMTLCYPWVLAALSGQGVIQGTIVDSQTKQPVPWATVSITGTERSVQAGPFGVYDLGPVPAGELSLRVQASGYLAIAAAVEAPAAGLRVVHFSMDAVAAAGQDLVSKARRESGYPQGESMARIWSERKLATTMRGLMSGSVPGAIVFEPKGPASGGGDVLLRGVKTIMGGAEPVIYIDGVRQPSTSRFRDLWSVIDVSLITRVEVIRGSAAAAQYGPGVAAGVILIYTRGR